MRNTPAKARAHRGRPRVVICGAGIVWWFVLALPLAAALIVFIAQNTEQATVRWTVWKIHAPLVAVILVTIFVTVVLTEILGIIWRRQRRRLLAEREGSQAEPRTDEGGQAADHATRPR